MRRRTTHSWRSCSRWKEPGGGSGRRRKPWEPPHESHSRTRHRPGHLRHCSIPRTPTTKTTQARASVRPEAEFDSLADPMSSDPLTETPVEAVQTVGIDEAKDLIVARGRERGFVTSEDL